MASVENKPGRGPRDPIMRAFEILLWMVDAEGSSWGLREMAAGVDMHPSTLHRLISHLAEKHIVRQDPKTGRYGLGPELMRLAVKAVARDPIIEIAQPFLQEIASTTGESTLLVIYDPVREGMMPVATVDSAHPVRSILKLGDYGPITAGSTGLAILAFLPERDQNTILSKPVIALTAQTVTDTENLKQILRHVREQGYAMTIGERTPGTAGVSAPIWDWDGNVIGAITTVFPQQRFRREDEPYHAQLLMNAANHISALFGAPDRSPMQTRRGRHSDPSGPSSNQPSPKQDQPVQSEND